MNEEIIIDKRLVKTFFSKKPGGNALLISVAMLTLCGIISRLYWLQLPWTQYLPASRNLVFNHHQYWRIFTTTFVHGDLGHLMANAYMLGILGYFVYLYFGPLVYPMATVIMAGFANLLTITSYPPDTRLIGASGLVYLLAGFWLTMFIFIERKRSYLRRVVIAVGVGLLVLFPTGFEDNVSYRAHFIGFVIGVGAAILYFLVFRKKIRAAEAWKVIVEVHDPLDNGGQGEYAP